MAATRNNYRKLSEHKLINLLYEDRIQKERINPAQLLSLKTDYDSIVWKYFDSVN